MRGSRIPRQHPGEIYNCKNLGTGINNTIQYNTSSSLSLLRFPESHSFLSTLLTESLLPFAHHSSRDPTSPSFPRFPSSFLFSFIPSFFPVLFLYFPYPPGSDFSLYFLPSSLLGSWSIKPPCLLSPPSFLLQSLFLPFSHPHSSSLRSPPSSYLSAHSFFFLSYKTYNPIGFNTKF